MEYDGIALRFPHWTEVKPVQQARFQAKWLSNWLTSAVGTSVNSIPVIAVTGWFIVHKKRSDVELFVGKNPEIHFNHLNNRKPLSDQLVQQIAHQVEAKCRDVEPKAYEASGSKMYSTTKAG